MLSRRNCGHRFWGTHANTATELTAITSRAAGRSRRIRRDQKDQTSMRPVRSASRIRFPVIRNPEMTKNTSTPTNPPGTRDGHRWYANTATTAMARIAWMSGRSSFA